MPEKKKSIPLKRGFTARLAYHFGMCLTRTFLKFEVTGSENIPDSLPYVIIANHETFVDGMWIASVLPPQHFAAFSALAGADLLTDYGWFGKLISHVGRAVPIDRKGNPIRGLITAKNQVQAGNILLVHPEGTRCFNGELGEFQSGAAYIAIKAGVPILPVYIEGGYEIFGRQYKFPHPFKFHPWQRRRLKLVIGKPIPTDSHSDPHALTREIEANYREQAAAAAKQS